jgi:hypothetical protein
MRASVRMILQSASMTVCLACLAGSDYAAWRNANMDGTWTRVTEAAVAKSTLPASQPADVERFCPRYPTLDANGRTRFWVGLLSAMARPESDFDPNKSYPESFKDKAGNTVISRGLLQLSIESANQHRYGCSIAREADLHDPTTNLTCATRILSTWVEQDGVIGSYLPGKPRGGGRYWSVMQQAQGHLPEITEFTRHLEICEVSSKPSK